MDLRRLALAVARRNSAIPGVVRQVIQTVKTDTFTTTSVTYTDVTGASVSITPASTSNKVLILAFGTMAQADSTPEPAHIQLLRDSTAIAIGDAAGSRVRSTVSMLKTSGSDLENMNFAISYLDSPASMSALTYKLQMRIGVDGGHPAYVGRTDTDGDNADYARTPTVIIAMEIAG